MREKKKSDFGSIIFMLCSLIIVIPWQIQAAGGEVKQVIDKTKYIDKYFEMDQDGDFKAHIYLGDQKISTLDNQDLYFPLSDHLGSPTIITDSVGQAVEINNYEDFGNVIHSESSVDNSYKFTGKELDTVTGLQYFGQRYYDSNISKFSSIDPLLLKNPNSFLVDPQQLNSYSYGRNNPISLVDKTGEKVSEFQPYYSSSGFYDKGSPFGQYRDIQIISGGEDAGKTTHNYQCVSLFKEFTDSQYGVSIGGLNQAMNYGKQEKLDSKNAYPGQFTAYSNGSNIMPQENDALTWSHKNGVGHIGIITEVVFDNESGQGQVYTLEQNFSGYRALFSQPLSRSYDSSGQALYTIGDRGNYKVQAWTRYTNQSIDPSIANQNYTNILHTPATGEYIY